MPAFPLANLDMGIHSMVSIMRSSKVKVVAKKIPLKYFAMPQIKERQNIKDNNKSIRTATEKTGSHSFHTGYPYFSDQNVIASKQHYLQWFFIVPEPILEIHQKYML